ncbi:MAG: STAS domain-containing protein [Holosporales bacterium]|jgi:SulP family sulfate permease|nr:STAS domain-containing protein [Holosporales bacterium]
MLVRKKRYFPLYIIKQLVEQKYQQQDFIADVLAGIVIALVAIPLGISLAISVGVDPQVGLYTTIVAGLITAIMGGSRFQITGPTAAFVAVLLPIVHQYGYSGLVLTTCLAGIFLLGMGYARFGRMIQFIPYPVTAGFTAGIGVVILSLQIKDLLGMTLSRIPVGFIDRLYVYSDAFYTFSVPEAVVGGITLTLILAFKKYIKKVPAPVLALPMVGSACFCVSLFFPDMHIQTLQTTFTSLHNGRIIHGIPSVLPTFSSPFAPLLEHGFVEALQSVRPFLLPAFVVAILAAIESLLSAIVADGITHTKHSPNAELIGLGVGNIIGSFFGTIPATGAIARTATNIRFGARSQIAAIIHAIAVLLIVLCAAPIISQLPMASLAALLTVVSFDMIQPSRLRHLLRIETKSDSIVLLSTFSLTVCFDMVIGVCIGIVLAALLLIKRTADVTQSQLVSVAERFASLEGAYPEDTILYQIKGPLFFGATEKAMAVVSNVMRNVHSVVFIMDAVPHMDITGFIAFDGTVKELLARNITVVIAGIQEQPLELLKKTHFFEDHPDIPIFKTTKNALTFLNEKEACL